MDLDLDRRTSVHTCKMTQGFVTVHLHTLHTAMFAQAFMLYGFFLAAFCLRD